MIKEDIYEGRREQKKPREKDKWIELCVFGEHQTTFL